VWAGFVISLAALWPSKSSAQSGEADQRARLHFDSGRAYYDVGDYENALREFRAAYDESHRTPILYNLYLCFERLSDLGSAIGALEQFLAETGSATDPAPPRPMLEERLANLRARAARGAATPSPEPVALSNPPSSASPVQASDADAPLPLIAIAGFSVAAAGLVWAGVALGVTLSENDSLGRCSPNCTEAQTSTIAHSAPMTDVGLGIAAAGAVVGLIGLLLPVDSTDHRVEVMPMFGGGQAGISLRGVL
jgi:hypothetical protein